MKSFYKKLAVLIAVLGITHLSYSQYELPKDGWSVIDYSAQVNDAEWSVNWAIDGTLPTQLSGEMWASPWSGDPSWPHHITIDIGEKYSISKVVIARRLINFGRIKDYELYLSNDTSAWGDPATSGTWEDNDQDDTCYVETPVSARYVKFVGLNGFDTNGYIMVEEINIAGDITAGIDLHQATNKMHAYPNPTNGIINVTLPKTEGTLRYNIFSITGEVVENGNIREGMDTYAFNLSNLTNGIYIIEIIDGNGNSNRSKVIKK